MHALRFIPGRWSRWRGEPTGLAWRHLLVLMALAVCTVGGFLLTQYHLEEQLRATRAMDLVTRDRFLVQTIALHAARRVLAPEDHSAARDLAAAIDELQQLLRRWNEIPGADSASEHYRRLEDFLTLARNLSPGRAGALALQKSADPLTADLTTLSLRLGTDNLAGFRRLHRWQILFMGLSLSLLVVLALLVVWPTLARLRRQLSHLENQRNELQGILDVVGEAIVVVDPRQRIRRINRKAAVLWQRPAAALLAASLNDLFPDGLGRQGEGVNEAAEQTRFNTLEILRGDGQRRPVRLRLNHVKFEGERRLILALEDVSATERVRRAHRESRSLLRLVMDTLPLWMALVGADRRYRYVNIGYARRFGQTPRQLVGRAMEDVLDGELLRELSPRIEAVLGGQLEGWDFSAVHDGEPRHLAVQYFPYRDDNGEIQGFLVLIQDITERKHQELVLREALDRADEARRFIASFVANISHEIRTPLNAILGFGELLGELHDQDKHQCYRDGLQRGARALLQCFNDLLDISRLEAGNLAPRQEAVDLPALVAEVVDNFADPARRRGLSLELDMERVRQQVLLDGSLLRQTLWNLLGNAVKFTEQGGVTVVGELTPSPGERQAVLVLAVSDTGPGIEPAHRDRIFEPFHQADGASTRAHGGSGLGLSISQRLVDLMGGRLTLQSTPGAGACFRMRIPVTIAAGEALLKAAPAPVRLSPAPAAPPEANSPALATPIYRELQSTLEEVQRRRSFSRLREFAERLQTVGECHELAALKQSGEALDVAVRGARVGEINHLLRSLSAELARYQGDDPD